MRPTRMRHLRIMFGLALAVCTFAVVAAPALATMTKVFKASEVGKVFTEAEPGKTKGQGVGSLAEATISGKEYTFTQAFKFGAFKVKCAKASSKGIVTASSFTDFGLSIKLGQCFTEDHFGTLLTWLRTSFKEPVIIVYHINGVVEIGTESEEIESEVKISGGTATFAVAAKICTIGWPAQAVPAKSKPNKEYSAAVYKNESVPTTFLKKFPSGFQHKMLIEDLFRGMKFKYESGQCSEIAEKSEEEEGLIKKEGHNGEYRGSILAETLSGNLEIGETEV
jgi:hypothetical protein